MRTQEEIAGRVRHLRDTYEDFGGWCRQLLISYLDYAHAQPFLKESVTAAEWGEPYPATQEAVQAAMLDYMPFAWGKANDKRGVSANRSVDKMTEWLWLYGDEALLERVEEIEYEHYGKERLAAICEHFGWDWQQWDDGVRTNE